MARRTFSRIVGSPGRFFRPGRVRLLVLGIRGRGPREFRLTPFRGFVAVLAIAGALFSAAHYLWLLRAGSEGGVELLLEERDSLRELSRGYARDTERMSERLQALEVQMRRLAVLAGAEPVAPRMGGLGGTLGSPGYDYVAERIEDLSGRLATLDRQGAALEQVMREKSRLLASTPSVWPVRGYVSSGYGRRPDPFTGEVEMHYGLDISADTGTPVRVTADGIVTETGNSATYGRYVVVSHGFDRTTRYAHLSRILVRRSQRIQRGTPVGEVGSTGRTRSPHLHYEVRVNNRARNPRDFILDYTP